MVGLTLLISVVLCTYNGSQFLSDQLKSISGQTRKPDELVVVDDCSMDNTLSLLEDFAAHSSFPVRIYNNPENLGSTKSFERAIGLSHGEIIFLCDQDDVWEENKIEKITNIFKTHPEIGLVFSNADLVDSDLNPLKNDLWNTLEIGSKERKILSSSRNYKLLFRKTFLTGATVAFHSSFKDTVLPIPREWVHDSWIALVISAYANFYAVPDLLVKYRQHPNQQIGAGKKNSIFKKYLYLKEFKKKQLEEEPHRFLSLKEKIAINGRKSKEGYQYYLNKKIEHLFARQSISEATILIRLLLGIRELAKGNYFYFSNGWNSFLRDLFL